MSNGIDELTEAEARERLEKERAELEEIESEIRKLLIEKRRKRVELRCLEYIEYRIACEEIAEEQPTMYPGADSFLN